MVNIIDEKLQKLTLTIQVIWRPIQFLNNTVMVFSSLNIQIPDQSTLLITKRKHCSLITGT